MSFYPYNCSFMVLREGLKDIKMKSISKLIYCTAFLLSVLLGNANQPVWINDGQSLMITEFMASNAKSLSDDANEWPDWCELYNPTNHDINLLGWYLSDTNTKLYKWRMPNYVLKPGAYKVIFLSDKNSISNPDYLHSNFKLEASGENLVLTKPDGLTRVWYFEQGYPEQYTDVSYGLIDGAFHYLKKPSPGVANIDEQYLPAPIFSKQRGYYKEPFSLSLSHSVDGSLLFYTTDCSTPTLQSHKYNGAIPITKTTVVRAVAYTSSGQRGIESVSTYLFVSDIVRQPITPVGYPSVWGPFTAIKGNAPGDYEMDPEICNSPNYKEKMEVAFLSLPFVSLVSDQGNFFSNSQDPENGGIYYYTGAPLTNTTYTLGKDWERPASVEYFIPNSSTGFQVNCGVQLNGGHSRRPEKSPKHSFRLLFKKEYGVGRLKFPLFDEKEATTSFDRLILRGGFNNTWIHSTSSVRKQGQYIHDSWAKDAAHAMGNPSGYNKFAHLFLNGLYWGVYNISERMDDEFMASYCGGNPEDYDVLKDYTEVLRGDINAWESMWKQASGDMSKLANYQKVLGRNPDGTDNPAYERLVDEANLIDYMLLNFYCGNNDWDHHNWVAGRSRSTRDGFKFLVWDSELLFTSLDINVTSENNPNCPSGIFQGLLKNEEFRMLLADRIYLHFFNDGKLTPESALEIWNRRVDEVQLSMICESARWGDYRRDGHPNPSSNRVYTLDGDWIPANNTMVKSIFPNRTEVVIQQLKDAGYYPSVDPPEFTNRESVKKSGDKLALYSNKGKVYYSLNSSDPRNIGGAVSPSAILYQSSDSVAITENSQIKARVLYNNIWSALASAEFNVGKPSSLPDVLAQDNFSFTAFPNPAREVLIIRFESKVQANISLSLYNLTGVKVKQLFNGISLPGEKTIRCNTGHLVPGVYLCRMETKGINKVLKINVVK